MISCGAEHIMANSGSITGSIGVISQYYNLSELLKFIKLDIEVLKSGEFKDTSSITKALSAEEKEFINNLLVDIHEQFKEIVKIERKLDTKEIEIVSKGQIFTGKQAKELRLIDSLGGLNNAKQYIENKIGLTDLELDYYPKKKEKLIDKDYREKKNKVFSTRSIDLHGYTLEEANRTIEKFINKCFAEQVNKLIVVTGKGIHSNNEKNPYVSKDLSILKYSIPEFISNNTNLMSMINEMSDAKIEDGGGGAFYIFLKKKKSIK